VLEAATGKPCYLMSHAVDTAVFRPELRDRQMSDGNEGPFRIGLRGTAYGGEKRARAGAAGTSSAGHGASRFFVSWWWGKARKRNGYGTICGMLSSPGC